jgi:hypothetical protein
LDASPRSTRSTKPRRPGQDAVGYYVFEVSKIAKASQQTPEQAKPTIKQLVISERRQKALDEFTKKFREKWRQQTKCQDGFVTQDCSNGPKPAATPAAHRPEPEPGAAAAIDELAPGMSASRATVAQLAAPPERRLAAPPWNSHRRLTKSSWVSNPALTRREEGPRTGRAPRRRERRPATTLKEGAGPCP